MGKYSVIESRHLDKTCALPAELATHANHHTARLLSNCFCRQFLFFPSGIQQLRRILCSLFRQQAAVLQVLIAGAVIAGGFILYNIIQNDPEAKKALGDAKGTTLPAIVTRLTDLRSLLVLTVFVTLQVKPRAPGARPRDRLRRHTTTPRARPRRPPARYMHCKYGNQFQRASTVFI